MKKTIKYISIEKVTYEFSEADIRGALLKEYQIEWHPDMKFWFAEKFIDGETIGYLEVNHPVKGVEDFV